jgi:carboxyl-terminal processing protease
VAISAYCNGTILFYKKTIQEKKHIIMHTLFQKKIIIPVVASAFLFVGVSFKDDYFEIAKQLEIFTTLFKELNKNYVDETTPAELMNNAIKGMLNSLDPYTVYFNEQEVLKFKINNTGEYTGIGALITRKDDKLILKEPYKNFPADKAGLKAGDEITQIGDTPLADFKDDASQLFKGSKNTKIDVKYVRQGKSYSTVIVLDEVEIKSVPYFAKIDDKTGYIVLAHFNKKASNETRDALEQLKKEGAERIVLDLRGNPGGLLNEAVNICNLFVPKNEIIVTTKSKIEKHNNTYKTSKEPVDTTIPLVILVNGRSASASEIVSGALQDLDRAVVLGSRSFGKGLVQRPVELTYGTQLKVTISRYYTPSGRCIQALDYAHKDKNGVATRTDAKNYNTFKTRKGRTVYDGGGVLPDIEMEETKTSPIANALLKNDGIFNFATKYYYKNPNLGVKIPVLTDADYSEFKQFLKIQKLSFDTETELALKNTLATAKKEKLDEGIAVEYQQLLTALQKTENALLDKNQKEIKGLLLDEIIKRYQYQEGLYDYYIKNNSEIKKAVSILNTSAEYNSILKI